MTELEMIEVISAFGLPNLGERVFHLYRPDIRTPIVFNIFVRPLGLDLTRKDR